MDLAYWGFRHWPFQRTYASDRFFFSQSHDEALARLLFLVEESRQMGLVTGTRGGGKTFLLKILQRRAQRLGRMVIQCDATGINGHELIGQIADGCSIARPQSGAIEQLWVAIRKKLEALALVRQPLLIVIDHFDDVDFSCHRAIARLQQIAGSIGAKLTVIIATHDLDAMMTLSEMVELRIDLCPWTEKETCRFVNMSVEQAGHPGQIFTDDALSAIYETTQGIPAQVTSLCNITLLAARSQEESLITSGLVTAAAYEIPFRLSDRQAPSYGIRK